RVFAPHNTVFILDHNVPSETVNTTRVQNIMRDFAGEHGCILYDGEGVCHQLMIERHVNPGQLVIAADSHTPTMGAVGAFGAGVGSTDFIAAMVTGSIWLKVPPTLRFELKGRLRPGVYARDLILKIIGDIGSDGAVYKTMEFGGPALSALDIDDRMVLCNLAAEAGAKNGIIAPDEIVSRFLAGSGRAVSAQDFLQSDHDCTYEKVYHYDLDKIEPTAARPHFVHNRAEVSALEKENIRIDQGFIGSCNNGRIEELRVAAAILKGRKIKPEVRLIISPASRQVQLAAMREGLTDIFLQAGAMVVNPNCSVCWGACQGVLGPGETLISTGTRNFKGRAGSPDSFVYLASAATVAASCLEGKIADPRKYDGKETK
ncbi:MAG: aconitase/3-isopropylmalate dehydratase large subunit family protein, partial [Spirochaetia bacterium]